MKIEEAWRIHLELLRSHQQTVIDRRGDTEATEDFYRASRLLWRATLTRDTYDPTSAAAAVTQMRAALRHLSAAPQWDNPTETAHVPN